jgi:surface protein
MSENTTVDQYLDELEIAKEDIKQAIEKKGAIVTGGLSSYAGFIDALETADMRQHLPNGICFEGSTIDVFNLSPYDWSMVYDYSYMFKDCTNLTGFGDDLGNAFENMLVCNNMFSGCNKLTTIPQLDTSKVVDMGYMFNSCSKLTTIPQMDTSKVINMGSLFRACLSLTSIPLLDTSNAIDMDYTFCNCPKITTIPQLDTSNVTNMNYMLGSCSSLTSIPLLDTSNVTTMSYMFYSCSSLTSIPLLDTSNVTNMSYMFDYCIELTTIPLLDTSNVTNMSYMFRNCKSLISIPHLDISKVTNMSGMFYRCYNLTEVRFKGNPAVTSSYVSLMFNDIATNGTLYYDSRYDYSVIKKVLPTNWKSIPYDVEEWEKENLNK